MTYVNSWLLVKKGTNDYLLSPFWCLYTKFAWKHDYAISGYLDLVP